jgi:hypothetical protein
MGFAAVLHAGATIFMDLKKTLNGDYKHETNKTVFQSVQCRPLLGDIPGYPKTFPVT